MRLRERQRGREWDTGGWGDVLGVDSRSCWNEIMRNRISEEIKPDVKIVPYIRASPKRKEERWKSDGDRLRKRCGGCFSLVAIEV